MRSQGVPGTPGTHGRRLHHPVRPCPFPCAWYLSCPDHWCGLRPCLLLVRQGLAPCQTVSGRGLPVLTVLTPQDRSVLSGLWGRPLFPGQLFVCPRSKVPGSSPVRTARISETLFRISDGPVFGTLARVARREFPKHCFRFLTDLPSSRWPGRTPCFLCRRMLERHSFLRRHEPQAGALPERGRQVLRIFGFLFVVQSPVSGQTVSRPGLSSIGLYRMRLRSEHLLRILACAGQGKGVPEKAARPIPQETFGKAWNCLDRPGHPGSPKHRADQECRTFARCQIRARGG